MSTRCSACGKPWEEHVGLQGVCERFKQLTRLVAQTRVAQRTALLEANDATRQAARLMERKLDGVLSEIIGTDVEAI